MIYELPSDIKEIINNKKIEKIMRIYNYFYFLN